MKCKICTFWPKFTCSIIVRSYLLYKCLSEFNLGMEGQGVEREKKGRAFVALEEPRGLIFNW